MTFVGGMMQNELTRKFHKSMNLVLVYLEIFLCLDLDDDNIPLIISMFL